MSNMNKTKLIAFTVLATIFYIVLEFAVDEKPFTGEFTGSEGSWMRWAALIAIPLLGLWQASQLGDREVEVDEVRENYTDGQVEDPPFWRAISGNVWWAITWLPLRMVLGIHWLQAGWHKTQDAGWARSGEAMNRAGEMVHMNRGDSMKGFLLGATTPDPETGATKAIFGWYADVLKYIADHNWTTWLGPMIAWGEVLVGLGLIFGGLVGIAAFFGTVMNMSFMLAGTVSANPWMFAMTVFIIIGWKVAGHLGLDRWFLPALGTPWRRDRSNLDGTIPPTTTTNVVPPARA